jgi:hypothetical protein
MINVGCGKTMLARQNVDGPSIWHTEAYLSRMLKKSVQQGRSE